MAATIELVTQTAATAALKSQLNDRGVVMGRCVLQFPSMDGLIFVIWLAVVVAQCGAFDATNLWRSAIRSSSPTIARNNVWLLTVLGTANAYESSMYLRQSPQHQCVQVKWCFAIQMHIYCAKACPA